MNSTRSELAAWVVAALIVLAPDPSRSQQQSEIGDVPRDVVAESQTQLSRHGYNPGPIDGVSGAQTKTAAEKFVSDTRLRKKIAEEPRKLLGLLHVWTANIRRTEEMIQALGYEAGPADGVIDTL